jgi:hypothetical protein
MNANVETGYTKTRNRTSQLSLNVTKQKLAALPPTLSSHNHCNKIERALTMMFSVSTPHRLVSIYESTQRRNPENRHPYRLENLTSHRLKLVGGNKNVYSFDFFHLLFKETQTSVTHALRAEGWGRTMAVEKSIKS